MKVYVYPAGESGAEFERLCRLQVRDRGWIEASSPEGADLAIAPLLRKKLGPAELAAPQLGTLVFHPSALPYRRGRDAIRHTIAAGERVSGVTWFWADEGLDTGPICERELVVLKPGESPGRAYHTRFVPAGVLALCRAFSHIERGLAPRVDQDPELATYDPPYDASEARSTRQIASMSTSNRTTTLSFKTRNTTELGLTAFVKGRNAFSRESDTTRPELEG